MSLRARLLAELNRPWRKDPVPVPALTLAYDGPGAVAITITEGRFEIAGRDGAASDVLDLDVDGLTLGALATTLGVRDGFTATVAAGAAPVLAVTLVDEELRPLTAAAAVFQGWTSPNWRVLEPARRALVDAAARLDIAIAQLNLLTSAGFFADLWGQYTSTTRRPPAHLPVTGGLVTVTAGSMLARAETSLTRIAWIIALGTPFDSTLFDGSTLEVGDVSVPIVDYLRKGAIGPGPGGDTDFARLVLAAPWPGPTQTTAAYRIVASPESDAAFTQRQVRELLRPRENNVALGIAIEEDTGIPVREVRDLERDVFIVSRTPLRGRPLRGRVYNAATAEIALEDLPLPSVVVAALTHAAAGIEVIVRGEMHPPEVTSDWDVVVSSIVIGSVPSMQIGVTPIGGGKIG